MRQVQFCMVNGCGQQARETVRWPMPKGTAVVHLCHYHAEAQRQWSQGLGEGAIRRAPGGGVTVKCDECGEWATFADGQIGEQCPACGGSILPF